MLARVRPHVKIRPIQLAHATHALEVFAVDDVVLLVDSGGTNTAAKNVLLAVAMRSPSRSWWTWFKLRVRHVRGHPARLTNRLYAVEVTAIVHG